MISNPYHDLPFTLAEWERIYRPADGDHSAMPNRLQQVMGETDVSLVSSSLRHEITARSRHLHVPKLGMRTANFKTVVSENSQVNATNVVAPPTSFFQLVNTIRSLKSHPTLPVAAFQSLFPMEFQKGRAFDINRTFGNGVDDDNDGEIDEPLELSLGQVAWDASNPISIADSGNPADPLMGQNSITLNLDPAVTALNPNPRFLGSESRQLFARHLYCLAQLLVPVEYNFPSVDRGYWQQLLQRMRPTNGNLQERVQAAQEYVQIRARILAQWAINVVDYRDADAVMSRFPYDPDPFDMLDQYLQGSGYTNTTGVGWNPSRNLTVDLSPPSAPIAPLSVPSIDPTDNSPNAVAMYAVWGMEQPELLMTESLAFHDLRLRRDPWRHQRDMTSSAFLKDLCSWNFTLHVPPRPVLTRGIRRSFRCGSQFVHDQSQWRCGVGPRPIDARFTSRTAQSCAIPCLASLCNWLHR